jgi:hypothetical protein
VTKRNPQSRPSRVPTVARPIKPAAPDATLSAEATLSPVGKGGPERVYTGGTSVSPPLATPRSEQISELADLPKRHRVE